MTQEILQALRNIEDKIMREPVAFDWTPSMDAIWPKDMRPTMSGLLAIWAAMHEAAVYTSVPKPFAVVCAWPDCTCSPLSLCAEAGGPIAADDGWVEWGGGRQPIDNGTLVLVRFRQGAEMKEPKPAIHWYWGGSDWASEIVAYKVVSP